jgi:hypothetical protein
MRLKEKLGTSEVPQKHYSRTHPEEEGFPIAQDETHRSIEEGYGPFILDNVQRFPRSL